MCLIDLSHIRQALYSLMFKKFAGGKGPKMAGDNRKTGLF
jgi:hypothetical protein